MGLADWGTIGAFAVKGIDNFSKWLKRKNRRDNVQGFDKTVDNRDVDGVNKRVSDLQRKAKNRNDSK